MQHPTREEIQNSYTWIDRCSLPVFSLIAGMSSAVPGLLIRTFDHYSKTNVFDYFTGSVGLFSASIFTALSFYSTNAEERRKLLAYGGLCTTLVVAGLIGGKELSDCLID